MDGTVYSHSLALQNGGVYEWGNFNDGTTSFKLTPELIDPADLNGIVAVYATGASSFALSSDGTVWDWGVNIEGELGLGSGASYSYSTPQHLIPPPGDRFTSLSDQADGDSVLATLAPVPEPIGVPLLSAAGVALLRRRRCRSA